MIIEKGAEKSFSFLQNEIDKAKLKNKVVISFIGFSGSGKGTQGIKLSKLFRIPHISLGDIIRHELRKKSDEKRGWFLVDFWCFLEYVEKNYKNVRKFGRICDARCCNFVILRKK